MKIYLDIDGVLLIKSQIPSESSTGFLKWALGNHDVYWLTTRCKGYSEATFHGIGRYFEPEALPLLHEIKPTNWDTLKTEAIDFDSDFLWFDDYVMRAELQVLEAKGRIANLVLVNLVEDPAFLTTYLESLKKVV